MTTRFWKFGEINPVKHNERPRRQQTQQNNYKTRQHNMRLNGWSFWTLFWIDCISGYDKLRQQGAHKPNPCPEKRWHRHRGNDVTPQVDTTRYRNEIHVCRVAVFSARWFRVSSFTKKTNSQRYDMMNEFSKHLLVNLEKCGFRVWGALGVLFWR